jgi:hypothetical protein
VGLGLGLVKACAESVNGALFEYGGLKILPLPVVFWYI